jgi:hypothetical protein
MHRLSLPEHGLRLALAVLASLAVTPAAGAEDGAPVSLDPVAMATALVNASLADLPVELPVQLPVPAAPQVVPAAAAEEPQPTSPPPAQPEAADPELPEPGPDPAASTPLEELSPPPEPQPAPAEPQYQPELPQYQPEEAPASAEELAPPAPPVTASPAEEWTWDWTWDCGPGTAPPAVSGDVPAKNWNWNWDWNCGTSENSESINDAQYHPVITQYHPVNVNVSIRIGSPGDDGPVSQTNVLVLVAAEPLARVAVSAAMPLTTVADPPAVLEQAAPAPATERDPPPDDAKLASAADDTHGFAAAHPGAAPVEAPSWNARPTRPARIHPAHPEAHRNRPHGPRPVRRPLPPSRVPAIPASSAGAAPLGGADGGGFHLALLLVPFTLALVDSARRLVRDAAPPAGRGHKKRRKRPG